MSDCSTKKRYHSVGDGDAPDSVDNNSSNEDTVEGDSQECVTEIKMVTWKKGNTKKMKNETVSLSQPPKSPTTTTLQTDKLKSRSKSLLSLTDSTQTAAAQVLDTTRNQDNCALCTKSCIVTTSIKCGDCNKSYHLPCCGLEKNSFPVAIKLSQLMGWTCEGCRQDKTD